MLTAQQQLFLTTAATASVLSERITQLPAELTLPQCIFESGWGKAIPSNNCFGIKVDQHGSGVQYVFTSEYINGQWTKAPLAFEKYDSLSDCFNDHARLITEGLPYKAAWSAYLQDHDLTALIKGVAAKYGTDPTYAKKILDMAQASWLKVALFLARSKS